MSADETTAATPLDLDEWERDARAAVEWGIVHDKPERILALVAEVRRLRADLAEARVTILAAVRQYVPPPGYDDAPTPVHLDLDAPPACRCLACYRASWDTDEIGHECLMSQPDDSLCPGVFEAWRR